ncbi:hypothetical protein K437DRAFT_7032 [Tilletiaria anomala UBC 951]|uniref:RING-type domain-containing protein n=1 Tax=Tilletiaria anomala (strain ATCC 24038 / CBS 436.72 / UBC 951) TaxID=1037660 RepID=A0A066WIV0_TILAU|nr:uncharacterized protein K437DRAFT_7032 [Tilletiaria anomala UBC 951]KDN52473.1 hypothetical protein K437DRAFT_7032 [Tilletiaria anomala UBC 951]
MLGLLSRVRPPTQEFDRESSADALQPASGYAARTSSSAYAGESSPSAGAAPALPTSFETSAGQAGNALAVPDSATTSHLPNANANTTSSGNRRQLNFSEASTVSPPTQERRGSHGREASGRSIRSALSAISLANLRERDREAMLSTIERRHVQVSLHRPQQQMNGDDPLALMEAGFADRPPFPLQMMRQQLANGGAAAGAVAAVPPSASELAVQSALLGPAGRSQVVASERKRQASRRERDEAATLFGPTLSNYFGTGSSSSGAVNGRSFSTVVGSGGTAIGAAGGSPAANANLASPGLAAGGASGAFGSRCARLGSRGRARGASLSGLSMVSLGAATDSGSSNLVQGVGIEAAAGVAVTSAVPTDLEPPSIVSGQQERDENVSMADGIELGTLARWVDRTVGLLPALGATSPIPPPSTAPVAPATTEALDTRRSPASALRSGAVGATVALPPAPVVCTTLQSYVNLKRNTVRLAPSVHAARAPHSSKAATVALAPKTNGAPAASGRTPVIGAGPLSSDATAVAAGLPPPTHTLQFEYDCAAPFASVHIFLRASRKHGSWASYIPRAAEEDVKNGAEEWQAGGASGPEAEKYLGERGMPPQHVLGFLVHGATLKKGFAAKAQADLALRLSLFAPPNWARKDEASGDISKAAQARVDANAVYAPISPTSAGVGNTANMLPPATPVVSPETPAMPQHPNAPLSKEERAERAAKEKAERETLKMAIIVEALDEDCKPLREPNLQTSYLRVSSLPARHPDGTVVDAGDRVWSLQVEGQEAEIGPRRFQLQELYGLSSKPPPVSVQNTDNAEHPEDAAGNGEAGIVEDAGTPLVAADLDVSNGSECLICLSDPPTTLLLPCTHGLCLQCAIQLRESVKGIRDSERRRGKPPKRKYACPVCRRVYTSMLHISTADEKHVA